MRFPACVLLVSASYVLSACAAAEDAAEFESKGIAALKLAQTESDAIIAATIYFGQATSAYDQDGNSAKAVEMNSFLYWCKKKMTLQQMDAFLKGGDAVTLAVAQRLKELEKAVPAADDAKTYFDRAESFAKAKPNEHLLIAIRFFEVADRFKGSELSLQAQDRSLQEMTLASQAPGASAAPPPLLATAKKLPIPSPAQQKESEKTIRDVFKDDFAKTTPNEKLATSKKLVRQAEQTADDACGRFVLLALAANLAAQTGSLDDLVAALDNLAAKFEGDLSSIAKPNLTALITTTRDATVSKIGVAYRTLLDKPDDGGANLIAGKFSSFVRGDCERGMPMLAKSNHAALSKIAKQDLANPQEPPAQIELGNAWWELAEKTADKEEKHGFQGRAKYWYVKALPSTAGLPKVKLEKRIEEASASPASHGTSSGHGGDAQAAPIDLLKGANPRDALKGEWKSIAGALECKSSVEYARYQFQTKLPAEYDIHFVFMRTVGEGNVGAMFTCAEQRLRFVLCGSKNTLCGLTYIDGKPYDQNPSRTPNSIENNKEYDVVVEVRKNSIRVVQNKKELFNYRFQTAKFSLDAGFGDKPLLSIYCNNAPALFKVVEIIPRSPMP